MKITRTATETILDGAGELTFTRNHTAFTCDGEYEQLRFENFTYIAYYGGLRARLRLCWMLWQWLGRK